MDNWPYLALFLSSFLSIVEPHLRHHVAMKLDVVRGKTPPSFMSPVQQHITAQYGQNLYLPCAVKNIGESVVTWVRRKDTYILSVDDVILIDDNRFRVYHSKDGSTWTLLIKYISTDDAGTYECQVSTAPKMSLEFYVNVAVPRLQIMGPTDVYVNAGSSVTLECKIFNSYVDPSYIFWHQEDIRILPQVGLRYTINSTRVNSTLYSSSLTIKHLLRRDSGHYTCAPEGVDPSSVLLHVIAEKKPEAMQQDPNVVPNCAVNTFIALYLTLVVLFLYQL